MSIGSAQDRLIEEQLYEQVANELASENIRQGLWAKALATAGDSEASIRSCYIQLRVQSLIDESVVIREKRIIQENIYASQKEDDEKIEQLRIIASRRKYSSSPYWITGILILLVVIITFASQ